MPSITAILVTYNSAHIIADALRALSAEPLISRICVVDNASADGTAGAVQSGFPGVELLEMPENLGFGRANNRALAKLETDFALLINPDARLEPGALAALADCAGRHADAGIVAPLLAGEDGTVQESYKRPVFEREKSAGAFHAPEGELCAGWISGACWLVRREAARQLGGFDDGIFLYYEDDDFCLRLRASGWACVVTPQARARHLQGRSSRLDPAGERRRNLHLTFSRLYLEEKYHGKTAARRLARRLVALYALKCLLGRQARYGGRLAGAWRFLNGNSAP